MPQTTISLSTQRLLNAWIDVADPPGGVPAIIGQLVRLGVRHDLEAKGYPDEAIARFIATVHHGTIDASILDPDGVPASAIAAQLDTQRRALQREVLIRQREREKAARVAVRMMLPVLRLFDELSQTGVQLPPLEHTLLGEATGHRIIRAFPHAAEMQPHGEGRWDACYDGTELKLRLTEQRILVVRVCRANSAFADRQLRVRGGLYYFGFLCDADSVVIPETECSTADIQDLTNWLARTVAAFEYNPPNVLGERPLEEVDVATTRTRIVDLSQP